MSNKILKTISESVHSVDYEKKNSPMQIKKEKNNKKQEKEEEEEEEEEEENCSQVNDFFDQYATKIANKEKDNSVFRVVHNKDDHDYYDDDYHKKPRMRILDENDQEIIGEKNVSDEKMKREIKSEKNKKETISESIKQDVTLEKSKQQLALENTKQEQSSVLEKTKQKQLPSEKIKKESSPEKTFENQQMLSEDIKQGTSSQKTKEKPKIEKRINRENRNEEEQEEQSITEEDSRLNPKKESFEDVVKNEKMKIEKKKQTKEESSVNEKKNLEKRDLEKLIREKKQKNMIKKNSEEKKSQERNVNKNSINSSSSVPRMTTDTESKNDKKRKVVESKDKKKSSKGIASQSSRSSIKNSTKKLKPNDSEGSRKGIGNEEKNKELVKLKDDDKNFTQGEIIKKQKLLRKKDSKKTSSDYFSDIGNIMEEGEDGEILKDQQIIGFEMGEYMDRIINKKSVDDLILNNSVEKKMPKKIIDKAKTHFKLDRLLQFGKNSEIFTQASVGILTAIENFLIEEDKKNESVVSKMNLKDKTQYNGPLVDLFIENRNNMRRSNLIRKSILREKNAKLVSNYEKKRTIKKIKK